jgi:hypothetical protein
MCALVLCGFVTKVVVVNLKVAYFLHRLGCLPLDHSACELISVSAPSCFSSNYLRLDAFFSLRFSYFRNSGLGVLVSH